MAKKKYILSWNEQRPTHLFIIIMFIEVHYSLSDASDEREWTDKNFWMPPLVWTFFMGWRVKR